MQSTAQGWLVLELTDSALLLGVVTAVAALPTLLFTLWAGELADRHDKRRMLVLAQSTAMLAAFAIAVLTGAGAITYLLLLSLVFVLGSASAFEIPTRQAFLVELVGSRDLTSAIALNSAAFNASRIVGPALAGVMIGTVGIAACFYTNAFTFLAVLAGLLLIRLPRFVPAPRSGTTLEGIREGIAYIRGDRLARTLVCMAAGLSVTALPYLMLLPVFARDVLRVGAPGLGTMLASSGAGALAAGLALAARGGALRRGRLILRASTAVVAALVGFALTPSFPLALLLLAGVGFAMILSTATANALLQARVPDRLRGRVMSVYVFMFIGTAPLGSLQAGVLARYLGAPAALTIGALAFGAIVAWIAFRVPELRDA